MSTTEAWTAELESSGRVVFPHRRRRLVVRLAIGLVLLANSARLNLEPLRSGEVSSAFDVLRLTAAAAFAYLVGWTVWQLATGRPVVAVDRTGARVGRAALSWPEIDRIEDPSGVYPWYGVALRPTDRRTRALLITKDNVHDLRALAAWLRSLHGRTG